MENFKSLRYETRSVDEKKKFEDMMMSNLGKWKYSPDQLVQKIPNDLMQAIMQMLRKLLKTYMNRL